MGLTPFRVVWPTACRQRSIPFAPIVAKALSKVNHRQKDAREGAFSIM